MKKLFTFKIAWKIGSGFGILALAIVINAYFTNQVLDNSRKLNEDITKVYQPSEELLVRMRDMINNSQMLIKSWVFVEKVADTPDKIKLVKLHNQDYPELQRKLSKISDEWEDSTTRIKFQNLSLSIDTLFTMHHTVMDLLTSMAAYNDANLMFLYITPLVSSDSGALIIKKTSEILSGLDKLISIQQATVSARQQDMNGSFERLRRFIFLTCLLLIGVSLLLAFFTVRSLVVPIKYMKKLLLSMSRGVLPDRNIRASGDEIGEMTKALNELVSGLKALSGFALEIGRGNYNTDFKPLSDDDVLGNALLRMRDDLKSATVEDTKRKIEDEQRNWATTGVAKFSDILRQDNDKLNALSYNVISNLVKYMDANQGGIFIINDNDQSNVFIELVACYAYNRKRHLEKNIQLGEGLVGRCILEKETIYLTDIPDNYVKINSGLGDANPRSLLLVPLAMNDDVFGVIEVASFKDIPAYQIDFVVKIAEIIAATLSTVKINMKTTDLLEQSRIQAEELAAQEEEMRQNMEELRATQEQSSRREQELQVSLEDMQRKLDGNKRRSN
jgi:methyl-accepting chemotaxis protein